MDWGIIFNFLDIIKNIDWKGVHVGIEGLNTGEEQLVNHIILFIQYIFVKVKQKNKPPPPARYLEKILENKHDERN